MKKLVSFASDVRVNALLAASAAVLLTACGGGMTDAVNGQQTQTAAQTFTSAPADTGAVAAGAQAAPAAGEAAGQAGGEFELVGYERNPLATPPAGPESAEVQAVEAPADGGTRLLSTSVGVNVATPATAYNYYVSTTGSDSNPGTKAAPFRTIQRAVKSATRASTTVWVAPGTYTGGIKTIAHGTSSGRIYYVSTTRHGARIVPPSSGTMKQAWDNRGNYVHIVGFDVDGAPTGVKWTNGIYTGGSYDTIEENRVRNIARTISCTSGGGSAIGVDSYYRGVYNNIISNTVHDIGPAGCTYVQGIYVSTSGTVKNNVVYRVGAAAIHLWHDANNVTITNNTVTSSKWGIVVGGGDFYYTTAGAVNVKVNSNIVYDNTYGISEMGKTGTNNTYYNNLIYKNTTNTSLRNGLTAKNTVAREPLFVSYSRTATSPNYKLQTVSPAIGKGTYVGAHPTDIIGRPRNATTGYDIGAYQH